VQLELLIEELDRIADSKGKVLIGKVVGVMGGDTVTVLVAGPDQAQVRLANLDTPREGTALRTAVKADPF